MEKLSIQKIWDTYPKAAIIELQCHLGKKNDVYFDIIDNISVGDYSGCEIATFKPEQFETLEYSCHDNYDNDYEYSIKIKRPLVDLRPFIGKLCLFFDDLQNFDSQGMRLGMLTRINLNKEKAYKTGAAIYKNCIPLSEEINKDILNKILNNTRLNERDKQILQDKFTGV